MSQLITLPEVVPPPLVPIEWYRAADDAVRAELYRATERLAQAVQAAQAAIRAQRDPDIAAAHAQHRALTAARAAALAPYVEHEQALKRLLVQYAAHEEAVRQERQRLADEEARRFEEAARLAAAETAEEAGDAARADAILNHPLAPPAVAVPRAVESRASNMREVWDAEVTDLVALCRAIGAGTVPPTAVVPNGIVLRNAARALRAQLAWPGVRAVRSTSVAVRR